MSARYSIHLCPVRQCQLSSRRKWRQGRRLRHQSAYRAQPGRTKPGTAPKDAVPFAVLHSLPPASFTHV